MIRMILLLLMLMVLTACSEFALLMSAGSVAATQNTYTKVYNGLDILTYMSTEKSIKKHARIAKGTFWLTGETVRLKFTQF